MIGAEVANAVGVPGVAKGRLAAGAAAEALEAGAGADAAGMNLDAVPVVFMARTHIRLEGNDPSKAVVENGDVGVVTAIHLESHADLPELALAGGGIGAGFYF